MTHSWMRCVARYKISWPVQLFYLELEATLEAPIRRDRKGEAGFQFQCRWWQAISMGCPET